MHGTNRIFRIAAKCTVLLSLSMAALHAAAQATLQIATNTSNASATQSASNEWWRHAAIYELYPRSFQDSDRAVSLKHMVLLPFDAVIFEMNKSAVAKLEVPHSQSHRAISKLALRTGYRITHPPVLP